VRSFLRIIAGGFAALGMFCAYAEQVTVTGSAEGDPASAGEQALTQALREAVRKGAGVDIVSQTKVTNMELEYDRVMTASIGYISEYKVISRSFNEKDKIYTVKVTAEVKQGRPEMSEELELKMLVNRMGSPRVMVECKEKINGSGFDEDSAVTAPLLEEMAQKTGLELFKKSVIRSRDDRDSARAALLGDDLESKVKKAGIQSTSDFKIMAKVKGSVGRMREPFPDVQVRNVSLGVDLQAVWTDTGEVVATVSLPTTFHKGEANMNLPFDMPDQLVRHYLLTMLSGSEPAFKDNNAQKLFRKVIAKWITELDLGAKIQLEFKQIDKTTLDKLIAALKDSPEVSYVWRREFDRRLYSVLEVETRLKTEQLENIVLKQLAGKYAVDVVTKRRLRFIPAGR